MLTHTIEVEVPGLSPESIWNWMVDMNGDRYRKWHPDHKELIVRKRTPQHTGTIVYFDELIGGKVRLRMSWKVTDSDPPGHVVFRARIPYPVTLDLQLIDIPGGTKVIHKVSIGTKIRFLSIVDKIISVSVFSKYRRSLLEKHAQEEFANLPRLIGEDLANN